MGEEPGLICSPLTLSIYIAPVGLVAEPFTLTYVVNFIVLEDISFTVVSIFS